VTHGFLKYLTARYAGSYQSITCQLHYQLFLASAAISSKFCPHRTGLRVYLYWKSPPPTENPQNYLMYSHGVIVKLFFPCHFKIKFVLAH
jgi:uncharacterized protein (UPF0254 family)